MQQGKVTLFDIKRFLVHFVSILTLIKDKRQVGYSYSRSWTSLDCPDSERQGWTRGAKETARIFFVSQAEGPMRVILVNYLKDKTKISKGFGY